MLMNILNTLAVVKPHPFNNGAQAEQLLDDANHGDIKPVFEAFYKPIVYYATVLGKQSGVRIDPKDIALTVFAKLHVHIHRRLPDNTRTFVSLYQVKKWLNTTTKTTFLDERDHLLSKQSQMERSFMPIDDETALMETQLLDTMDRYDLLVMIEALPQGLRDALKTFYIEGHNLRETARVLSLCENAAAGRLKRAITRIQAVFRREFGFE